MAITQKKKQRLTELSRLVRYFILRSTTAAGSGHPTSSLSATDLMVTLLFGDHFRQDLSRPQHPNNDRLIFSKGHASPLLYSLYAAAGKVSEKELLTLRKFGSRLEGHPTAKFPYTAVPTGSLGMGLSIGLGMATAGQLNRRSYRTYVLLGDSELMEGANWEAIQLAAHRKVDTLTAILDVNRLGQSGATMYGHNVSALVKRTKAFGWNVIALGGHALPQIDRAFTRATRTKNKPTMLVAKTIKGKGIPFLENKNGWHGKALSEQELQRALDVLGPVNTKLRGSVKKPAAHPTISRRRPRAPQPNYRDGDPVATRRAIGSALVRLAQQHPEIVTVDADVGNSTYTELFGRKYPKRFVQTYIAEQNMVGMCQGLARAGMIPVAATFAAFWSRAFDQLRMAQYADTTQVYVGSHAGVSIGEDGPSQMGLEDIAQFRSLSNSVIYYPADAYAAERLFELAVKGSGIVYLRGSRPKTPILYGPKTTFREGGSHTIRQTTQDRATLISSGVTLFEALDAAARLDLLGINVRVIDLYSIKPLDVPTLRNAAKRTKHLVVIEDHVQAGGIAEAVMSALGPYAGVVTSLAVHKVPRSGTGPQLLRHQGIDASAIVRTVRKLTAKH